MSNSQRRTQALKNIEFRDGDSSCFRGHAAVFYNESPDTEYWIWWDYVERLMPGCFDRALNDGDDCRHLFNHDSNKLLGRLSAGTLSLAVDDVGLRFESPYDDTDPDHVSYRSKIIRGDLQGCSFSFGRDGTSSTFEEIPHPLVEGETLWIRNITEVGFLYDVGGVTYPAYEGTDIEANSRVNLTEKRCRAHAFGEEQIKECRAALTNHRDELEREKARRWAAQAKYDFQAKSKGLT